MKKLMVAGIVALAIGPVGSAFGLSDADMNVLGKIQGTLDGKPQEWVTFSGDADGEAVASANWQRGLSGLAESVDFESMASFIPPEQLAQLEAMGAMPGGDNPMAAMMAQMGNADAMAAMMGAMSKAGEDTITLTISGLDPDSPNRLLERFLVIEVLANSADELVPGVPHRAEIHYFFDASSGGLMPDVLYVSEHDDNDASVTFERVELASGGGHAAGRFSALLCRLEMKMLMQGPDRSDCMRAEGTFDTKLLEDKSS